MTLNNRHTANSAVAILANSGRDEMNLAEFPFATLNSRDSRDIITYEGSVVEDGTRQAQKWVVRSASGLGLPTEFGERLMMALITITAEENFTSPKVTFTIGNLIKRLGIAKNRDRYRRIEEQLDRLVGVTIHSENAFWDQDSHERVTTKSAFHLIESVWLRSREKHNKSEDPGVNGYIIWSKEMWASFQAGYIKSLDLDFFYQLPTPLSRRLYRFLDKRMRYQENYEIDIFDLSNRLGCVRYEAPSQVKRLMQPACNALIKHGFLDSAEMVKRGRYHRFYFVKATDNEAIEEAEAEPIVTEPELILNRPKPASESSQLWGEALNQLQGQMTKSTFETWLKPTTILYQSANTLIVGVENDHAQQWLDHRLRQVVERVVEDVWARPMEVVFDVA